MSRIMEPQIKLILLLAIYCITAPLYGQDLKVTYNYNVKKVTYTDKSGKVVKDGTSPKLKKGGHISVEVNNVNPNVYYVEVRHSDSAVTSFSEAASNLTSSFKSFGIDKIIPGGGMLSSALDGIARGPIASKGSLGPESSVRRTAERHRRLQAVLEGFRYQMLLAIDSQIRDINKDVTILNKFNDTVTQFGQAIDAALHDKLKSEDAIRKAVDSLESLILGNSAYNGMALKARINNNCDVLKQAYYQYLAYTQIYDTTSAKLKYALTKLDSNMVSDIDSSMDAIDFEITRQKHIYNIQSSLDSVVAGAAVIADIIKCNSYAKLSSTIDNLVQKGKTLKTSSFSYSKPDIIALKDFKNITILVYDTSDGKMPGTLVETKNITLTSGHPLYSLPGVGVSFSRMFQQQYTYQNQKTVVSATKASVITPSVDVEFTLATSTNNKNVAVGGTAGVGLALIDQTIDFMLGPSFLFGTKQKVMLSIGVMAGQETKLQNGVKVGDILSASDSVVPTNKVFAFGYFLGLSYVPKF